MIPNYPDKMIKKCIKYFLLHKDQNNKKSIVPNEKLTLEQSEEAYYVKIIYYSRF